MSTLDDDDAKLHQADFLESIARLPQPAVFLRLWARMLREDVVSGMIDTASPQKTRQLEAEQAAKLLPLMPKLRGMGEALKQELRNQKISAIIDRVVTCGGNYQHAADSLGCSRFTVYRAVQRARRRTA